MKATKWLAFLIMVITMVGCNKVKTPEAVDLGLSVKWASFNIGADTEEDYGYIFAWGETEPKKEFSKQNSKTYEVEGFEKLSGEDDAANVLLGKGWRMPTQSECNELINKCKWEWTRVEGKGGYRITGPNGNSIFLPITPGDYSYGKYWTSNPYIDEKYPDEHHEYGTALWFSESGSSYSKHHTDNLERYEAACIRPVVK